MYKSYFFYTNPIRFTRNTNGDLFVTGEDGITSQLSQTINICFVGNNYVVEDRITGCVIDEEGNVLALDVGDYSRIPTSNIKTIMW
jgi:hypothetical protein